MPRIRLNSIDAEVWEEAFPEGEWERTIPISREVQNLIYEVNHDYRIYQIRMNTRKHYQKIEVENFLNDLFKD